MKIKKVVACFCAGLMINVAVSKSVKAELISLITIGKIVVTAVAVGSFWVALENKANAKHSMDTNSVLNHLEDRKEFPVTDLCVSPDLKMGIVEKAYFVSIDDTEKLRTKVKSELCQAGGFEKRGKYAVGAFTSEYHAISFSSIVQRRLGDDVQVYVGKNPLKY